MLGFLAGVPGKLKALNDRLTSTWAAKLDALRTGLTDVRMGYLDKLNITGNAASSAEVGACAQKTDPSLAPPSLLCAGSTSGYDQLQTSVYVLLAPASPFTSANATTTSWTDVINYTGAGVLEMLCAKIDAHATSAGAFEVIIDGVTVYTGSLAPTSNSFAISTPVGTLQRAWNGSTIDLIPVPGQGVPFRTSLQVRHRLTTSGSTQTTRLRYRRA